MTKTSGASVGIDIGASLIKMLQVSGPAEKPIITGMGFKDVSGLSGAEISDSLKSIASESRISAKEAVISLSGPSVIVRFITLPKMNESALKGAIRYEAEKFIPYNISDCVVDFQTLNKDDKENKFGILLVAAKKEYVQEKIKTVEKAGFSVRVVDVDSFAVTNAFLRNHKTIDPNKSYAVLNMGGVHTNLSILKGDIIHFVRDVAIGGNDFTFAISRRLGVDQKSAEELKLRPVKEKEQEIAECVKNSFNDLLDEIKLSFGYYENQAGKGVDEVYISGGSANMGGFKDAFEDALGVQPISWDPLEFMDVSAAGIDAEALSGVRSSFGIAAGLCLR